MTYLNEEGLSKGTAKEQQNQGQIDEFAQRGPATMGPWTSHIWRTDPRHLGFLLARYKFCARMLQGKSHVLEVGCGDAFGTPVVLQTVKTVHCLDFEPLVLAEAERHVPAEFADQCTFAVHDMTLAPLSRKYDAAYALDVIEHVTHETQAAFMSNLCDSLRSDAICILGTPNIEAAKHASEASAAGHVNLKSAQTIRNLMLEYFDNAFVFSMNDEVVHTGYYPMAHYLIGVGCGVK